MDVIAHVHVASGLAVFQLRQVVRFLVKPLKVGPSLKTTQLDIRGFVYIVSILFGACNKDKEWEPLTGLAGSESISWTFGIRVLLSDLVLIRDY